MQCCTCMRWFTQQRCGSMNVALPNADFATQRVLPSSEPPHCAAARVERILPRRRHPRCAACRHCRVSAAPTPTQPPPHAEASRLSGAAGAAAAPASCAAWYHSRGQHAVLQRHAPPLRFASSLTQVPSTLPPPCCSCRVTTLGTGQTLASLAEKVGSAPGRLVCMLCTPVLCRLVAASCRPAIDTKQAATTSNRLYASC